MTAIHRRGAGDIWQGLWEPLLIENEELRMKNGEWGMEYGVLLQKNVRHVLTHRILLADFYLLETDERPELPDDYIWIREEDMDQYAVPRLVNILLESLPKY